MADEDEFGASTAFDSSDDDDDELSAIVKARLKQAVARRGSEHCRIDIPRQVKPHHYLFLADCLRSNPDCDDLRYSTKTRWCVNLHCRMAINKGHVWNPHRLWLPPHRAPASVACLLQVASLKHLEYVLSCSGVSETMSCGVMWFCYWWVKEQN